jgi:hypothetical protein
MKRLCAVLPSLLLAAACSGGAPAGLTVAGPSALASAPLASTTVDRRTFQRAANVMAPSQCLGGTFRITGTITGWVQTVVNPEGHLVFTQHADFSRLTATLGTDSWSADPGSHEIWSESLTPAGSGTVTVHEGRSRFTSSTGAPDVLFVHRIHRLWLPDGENQLNDVTFEAECYGPA